MNLLSENGLRPLVPIRHKTPRNLSLTQTMFPLPSSQSEVSCFQFHYPIGWKRFAPAAVPRTGPFRVQLPEEALYHSGRKVEMQHYSQYELPATNSQLAIQCFARK